MKKLLLTISVILLTANSVLAVNISDLIFRPGEKSASDVSEYPETGYVADLPEVSIEAAITSTVKTILGWAMIISIIALVVSAIFYIQSRGKEEDVTKAKDIMLYLIIGMAIMAAAYGIVIGLSQFEFFTK